MSEEQIVHVDPSLVLADDNSRFNLKKSRIESLAASILESGGVLVPLEVEPLVGGPVPTKFHLTSGYYRYAAVLKLNAEQNAGLTIPVIVRSTGDPKVRLAHQLAENMERENQSPMDQAVAIKKLLDLGVARVEVRRIFARPGGPKGQVSPASNAWVNIMTALLTLPKSIQEKIHDGRVGLAAAYELGKVPADRRAAVLERAESDRQEQLEKEERDEERYLSAESKLQAAQSKVQEATVSVETLKGDIAQATALVTEKKSALMAVRKEWVHAEEEGKKAANEKLKAAEADMRAAEKLAKEKTNDLAKMLTKQKTAAETAEEQAAKLEAARKPGKKAVKAVGAAEVKKAAKVEGVGAAGYVALNISEIRQSLKDLCTEMSTPKARLVFKIVRDLADGKITPKECAHDIGVVTGEVAGKVKPVGAPKTEE